jgi:hypothetical protein
LRHVFETVMRRCRGEGLVGGEGFAADASVIRADANRTRGVPKGQVPAWEEPSSACEGCPAQETSSCLPRQHRTYDGWPSGCWKGSNDPSCRPREPVEVKDRTPRAFTSAALAPNGQPAAPPTSICQVFQRNRPIPDGRGGRTPRECLTTARAAPQRARPPPGARTSPEMPVRPAA